MYFTGRLPPGDFLIASSPRVNAPGIGGKAGDMRVTELEERLTQPSGALRPMALMQSASPHRRTVASADRRIGEPEDSTRVRRDDARLDWRFCQALYAHLTYPSGGPEGGAFRARRSQGAATKTVRLYGKEPQRGYGGFVRRSYSLRRKTNRPKQKTPSRSLDGVLLITSLTITYFHTGCSTIIGAKSFHGPVRDGKGWDRLAMVIRHDLYERRHLGWRYSESGRSKGSTCIEQTALYS